MKCYSSSHCCVTSKASGSGRSAWRVWYRMQRNPLYWNSFKLMKWLISLRLPLVWSLFFILYFDAMVAIYSSQANFPPLRQFKMDMNPLTADIMNWLCRCHTTPTVHTLGIRREITVDSMPTIYNYFQHLGSASENLTYSLRMFLFAIQSTPL